MTKHLKLGSDKKYFSDDGIRKCDFCDRDTYFHDEVSKKVEENDVVMCSVCLIQLFVTMKEGLEKFKKDNNL